MVLYKHTVTVEVITPEGSPDSVIAWIEEGAADRVPAAPSRATSFSACVTRESRAATPYQRVADPPAWPTGEDKRAETRYFAAVDAWRDTLPRADVPESFRPEGAA